MEWLLILVLGVWVAVLHSRLGRLERSLGQADPEFRERPQGAPRIPPSVERRPQPRPGPAEPAVAAARTFEPAPAHLGPPRPRPQDRPPPKPVNTQALSNWLAENGLAWLGGGALALGGLLLAAYAAQRGFFTPPMRIGAAIVVGGLMIAASEWIRRQANIPGGQHQLAAGAASGAGGATVYGAVWAANHLYHLIPFPMEASLIVALSAGLLAYAWLQGEALAVLALGGAFAAPALTGVQDWGSPAIEIYLSALIATGFGFSAVRGWFRTGYLTLAATVFWVLPSLIAGPPAQPALLILAAPLAALGAVVFAQRRWRPGQAILPMAFTLQVSISLGVASLLSVGLWSSGDRAWIAAGTSAAVLALCILASVRGHASGWLSGAPIGGAVVGIGLAFATRALLGSALVHPQAYAALPAAIAVIGLIGAVFSPSERTRILTCAGVGAAVVATLVWPGLERAHVANAWLPAALVAGIMAAGSWLIVGQVDDRTRDRGLGLWLGGAAELAFLAIFAAGDPVFAPLAEALAAVAFAALAVRLNWSGLGRCATAGALAAVACMLRPGYLKHAINDAEPWLVLALSLAGAAAAFAAGRILRRGSPSRAGARYEADGLESASLIMALLGGFYAIEHFAAGPAHSVGPHLAASLRTLILLAATLLLVSRAGGADGPISRWRLRVQLIVTLVHGLTWQMLAMSPWWGFGEAPLGPAVVNTLLISYLAPALILTAIYRRRLFGPPQWTRAIAVAAFLFGLVWVTLTVRHGFHPKAMHAHWIGRSESCAYALTLLAAAAGLIEVRRRAAGGEHPAAWLAASAETGSWLALFVSAVVFWLRASPWWGLDTAPLAPRGAAVLLFALYALGGVGAFAFGGRLQAFAGEGRSWRHLAQAAKAVGVVDLFMLITLLVRNAYQGQFMARESSNASVQTWSFSAVWALFGLAILLVGGHRRDYTLRWLGLIALMVTVVKVLAFDMSRLDGVIRAGSFLAVGALLMAGAVAARRLNARALLFAPKG